MKALLLHCKNYHIKVGLLANRPVSVSPEPIIEPEQTRTNCVVALVTVENGDDEVKTKLLSNDIRIMAENVARQSIVIFPFAHLSNNLADSKTAIDLLEAVKNNLSDDYQVIRSHFGSHKEFLLDVFGHPGNARFRDY